MLITSEMLSAVSIGRRSSVCCWALLGQAGAADGEMGRLKQGMGLSSSLGLHSRSWSRCLAGWDPFGWSGDGLTA